MSAGGSNPTPVLHRYKVHPSQTPHPRFVILSASFARRTYVLCLYHDQSFEDAVHRRHQQSHAAGARAQNRKRFGIYSQVQTRPLVYFERFKDIRIALEREKRIKGWLRIKKIALVVSMNPSWRDLSEEWYRRHQYEPQTLGH